MRRALIIVCLCAGLLVGAWYAFCIWCGWWQRIEPPAMHPSWSEQQKYELLALDHELRYNPICAAFGLACFTDGMSWWEEALCANGTSLAWGWRRFCKPAREALHEVMATGRGDVRTIDGYPVALYALRFHKVALVKALVEHGYNPAAPYVAWDAPFLQKEYRPGNLLVDALEGAYMDHTIRLASRERLDLLNFLEQHGASIDTMPDTAAAWVNAACAAFGDDSDGGAAVAWLLRRGLPVSEGLRHSITELLQMDACSEVRKTLQREGLLPGDSH